MQNVIETWLSTKQIYSLKEIDIINQLALKIGIKNINLPGMYVEKYLEHLEFTNIFVSIEQPLGYNNSIARLALLQSYHAQFTGYIRGFNFGVIGNLLDDNDWDLISKDIELLSAFCNNNKLIPRLFINLHYLEADFEMLRLSDIAEQKGIKEIICGVNWQSDLDFKQIEKDVKRLLDNCSVPVGVFGNIQKSEQINNFRDIGLNPVIVLPKNLLQIFS